MTIYHDVFSDFDYEYVAHHIEEATGVKVIVVANHPLCHSSFLRRHLRKLPRCFPLWAYSHDGKYRFSLYNHGDTGRTILIPSAINILPLGGTTGIRFT